MKTYLITHCLRFGQQNSCDHNLVWTSHVLGRWQRQIVPNILFKQRSRKAIWWFLRSKLPFDDTSNMLYHNKIRTCHLLEFSIKFLEPLRHNSRLVPALPCWKTQFSVGTTQHMQVCNWSAMMFRQSAVFMVPQRRVPATPMPTCPKHNTVPSPACVCCTFQKQTFAIDTAYTDMASDVINDES